jgi:phage/plasmid primase-like uncharacterized protein
MTRLERIVASLGGALTENGRRALIPGPGHSAVDRSVSLALTEDGRLIVHCFSPKDDWRAVRDFLRDRGLLSDGEAKPDFSAPPARPIDLQPKAEDRVARARTIWNEGIPLTGTVAERYLRLRGVTRALGSPALRFHPRATSLDDRRRRPALLASLTDSNGEVQGVQITLLSQRGASKAIVPTPRRVVGKLVGGAVRLDVSGATLATAEGVETALSASEALKLPAWAALTAWNLAHFVTPEGIERLVIAADNGVAGIEAANALKRSVGEARSDLSVTIEPPPLPFSDWNDWARAQTGKA